MKNSFKYIIYSFLFVFVFLGNSCKTRQKLVYLQDFENSNDSINESIKLPEFNFKFQKGDIVVIHISSFDKEVARPFNNEEEKSVTNSSYSAGNPSTEGYLIDENGEVNLPVIGKLKIVNLTKSETTKLISSEVELYIKEPVISLRLSNFKVTVLGSVTHPGTFSVPNERISIFEAIGLTGDLKITGKRKNVLLVRNEQGINKKIRLDLTSNDILSSPYFYLNQNDIIYIEPNYAERYSSTNLKVVGGLMATFISAFFTILFLSLRS